MRRILAEVRVPAPDPDAEDNILRDEDGEPILEMLQVYLHHWGTQYETIQDQNGNISIGQYTVGICEEGEGGKNPGQIHTFMPTQLKLLGLTTYQ